MTLLTGAGEHCCAILLAYNLVLAFFPQEASMFERGAIEAEPVTPLTLR